MPYKALKSLIATSPAQGFRCGPCLLVSRSLIAIFPCHSWRECCRHGGGWPRVGRAVWRGGGGFRQKRVGLWPHRPSGAWSRGGLWPPPWLWPCIRALAPGFGALPPEVPRSLATGPRPFSMPLQRGAPLRGCRPPRPRERRGPSSRRGHARARPRCQQQRAQRRRSQTR